ncbi:MAG TPA: transporter substrate-binding domain-containing protein [Accumulibacter sp.]|nr:transporter substrate-binding domain-containing protein [Accumulibacter sp.]
MFGWRRRAAQAWWSALLALATSAPALAADGVLRVAVLSNSPPMSYTDAAGRPAGFNVGIAHALCEAMELRCRLTVVPLQRVIPAVAAGEFDFAAVSLLDTAERRAKVLFSQPYYRSSSVWFAKPGVEPGAASLRVAAVAGSAQWRYAMAQGWKTTMVRHHSELPALLAADKVDAVLIPMATALTLRQDSAIQPLGLVTTIMHQAELSGDVCFAVNPARPELREQINEAFDRIKRDGRFDRLNSEYLPFRLQ